MNSPQLAELERRAYRSVVDDGLLDTLLGLFILSFGVSKHAFFDGLPALVFLGCLGAWRDLRKNLVEPRVGHVRLNAERRSQILRGKRAMMALFCVLALALGLALLVQGGLQEQLRGKGPLIGAIIFASTIVVGAFALDLRRMIGYAALVLLGGIWQVRAPVFDGGGWIVSGGLIATVGLVILMRFLHQHPLDRGSTGDSANRAQQDA